MLVKCSNHEKHTSSFLQGMLSEIDFIGAPRGLLSWSWVVQSQVGTQYPQISTSDHRPVAGEITLPPKSTPTTFFKNNNDNDWEPNDEHFYHKQYDYVLNGYNKKQGNVNPLNG